ncbi:MAG: ABC transporter permease subunit [Anaerolineae bacterium]|nr:ABC transporter permease subunit [Anaerolineae bacterium]
MATRHLRRFLAYSSVSLFALILLTVYLSPFSYMSVTAFKDISQITDPKQPLLPVSPARYSYQGDEVTYTYTFQGRQEEVTLKPGDTFDVYQVPTEDGSSHRWALVVKRRGVSFFLDPRNTDAGLIEWQGEWRTLQPVYRLNPQLDNFARAWNELKFPRVIRNTLIIAVGGDIGTLISCILVAYGFSRFRIPGKNILFIILISTILLPSQVTLIPTYAFFARIGWVGTFLPLVVPHFFANAYNVFLLRQFFMTIPLEMDEAAMMDGAGPFRTLISVILPQAVPAVVTVALFHFLWAWNDYFGPLIYLSTRRDLQPMSVAIQLYNQQYTFQTFMVQATALMGLALPVFIFFLAQRALMRGVVITGVEK